MLFFILGAVCFGAFLKVAFGHHHGHRHHRRGRRKLRFMMDRAFDRLDTSPGQEKEIRSAIDALLDDLKPARREMGKTMREQIREAMGEELFDEAALRAKLEEHETRMAGLRESLLHTLGRIHEALDVDQRKELARMMRRMSWGGRRCHMRHHHHPEPLEPAAEGPYR